MGPGIRPGRTDASSVNVVDIKERRRTRFAVDQHLQPVRDPLTEIDRLRAEVSALQESNRQLETKAAQLQAILDIAPAQIWFGDARCQKFVGNKYAYRDHRLPDGVNASFDAEILELPEGLRLEVNGRVLRPDEMPMQVAARTGRPVEGFVHEVVHPDGVRQTLVANVAPTLAEDGSVTGVVGVYFDITSRVRAEEELKRSEARITTILEHLPVAIGVLDAHGRWTMANERMRALAPETMPSRDAERRADWRAVEPLPPSEWPGARALRGEVVQPGILFIHTGPEGERYLRVSASPIECEGRREAVAAVEDVDDLVRAQQRLDLLTRELEHRTRNITARVMALVTMAQREQPADLEVFLHERLAALARTQDLLTGEPSLRLRTLLESELEPYVSERSRIELTGPEVVLTRNGAENLGMLFHELVTNAAKHGSLSGGGRLSVLWRMAADGLSIEWVEEQRTGIEKTGPLRKSSGFGSKLIDAIARNMHGKVLREVSGNAFLLKILVRDGFEPADPAS